MSFATLDEKKYGLIDEKEFAHFVNGVLGLKLKKPELVKLWGMLDVNRSGSVNFVEFSEMLFPHHAFADEEEKDGPGDGEQTFKLKQAATVDNALALFGEGVLLSADALPTSFTSGSSAKVSQDEPSAPSRGTAAPQ